MHRFWWVPAACNGHLNLQDGWQENHKRGISLMHKITQHLSQNSRENLFNCNWSCFWIQFLPPWDINAQCSFCKALVNKAIINFYTSFYYKLSTLCYTSLLSNSGLHPCVCCILRKMCQSVHMCHSLIKSLWFMIITEDAAVHGLCCWSQTGAAAQRKQTNL